MVQNGVLVKLLVYECKDQRGLGLRTLNALTRGQFVCEYAGEVLKFEEAKSRSSLQSNSDKNYIIGIREHSSDSKQVTFIDPTKVGNVGRFINHSCDPNLVMVPVRVDSEIVRLGLFATRNIQANEELTFNYGGQVNYELGSKKCFCKSTNCSGFLPFDASLY